MLIDTHTHLNFDSFNEDFDDVLLRAKEAGVMRFLNISTGLESAQKSVEFSAKYDDIFATVGVHPCYCEGWTEEAENYFRKQLDGNEKVVAVGEIGLDYLKGPEDRELQKDIFRKQILMAKEFDRPFVVHCREAGDDVWAVVEDIGYYSCVFHCYAEDLEFAKKLWERGVLVSFNGTVTYKKNDVLRDVAKNVPAELFMLETDCPFLPPQRIRGERCEPSHVREFAEFIADLRGVSWEQVAEETTSNAERFFKFSA